MLAINPNLNGKQIIFRESMKKYDSDNKLLGILKLSAPRPLYLNRPFITILEKLEVEPKTFLFLLMENLKNLANSLICECSAITILQDSCTLGIPYRKLYKSGIPFLSEPIFRQIVDCVIHHRINELRLKARIKIPMNCGRTVFGVLDETNTLNYGEVFVRLSHIDEDGMPEDECFILKDEIMVTKFPCLHPGDVRKFEAVDIPELHHIKDCIVFPAKGQRPHPNEMAGSDLDGDEYAIVWNSDLIFKGENHEAMLFPTSKAKELPKDAEVGDILDFYCDYIISNNIGLLANAHLANADLEEEGILSDKCMSLAKKSAIALDFAKTGTVEAIEWYLNNF
jgi:RNA-dependent RNA polymerase